MRLCVRAFTLIEVAACLVLVGLLSGLVVVSLHQSRRQVLLEDGVARVIEWDRQCRNQAQRRGQALQLTIDPAASTASSATIDDSGQTRSVDGRMPLTLPWGLHLSAAWSADGAMTTQPLTLRCDPHGRTPSYAVAIAQASGGHEWVLFAGATGQATRWENDDAIQTLWTAVADAPRADID